MSDVDVRQGRARVQIESTIYGAYDAAGILELRTAVMRACRAIGTDEALRLAQAVEVSR